MDTRSAFRLPFALGLLGCASALPAQGTPPLVTACHDFTAVDAEMSALLAAGAAPGGASLRIERNGRLLFERTYGGFGPTTQVSIASATKWLSGAVVLALVDDGLLDLDAPVSSYLPEFAGGPKASMTVRQMFSHTSGLPGRSPLIGDPSLTLAQAVQAIARTVPLRTAPGTDFYYGGVSMHVAGRVAEVVSGLDWNTLFERRIAQPLGMTATDYAGLGVPPGNTNPRIAGGARSTLRDYGRFVEMVENRGVFRGRRILSERAVATMLADQTGGVPVAYVPPTYSGSFRGYGIGCWMERVDAAGATLEATSPGAFGFTGFVDVERGTAGVFMVDGRNARTDPFADRVRALTRAALRFEGVDCYGNSFPACRGPLRATTRPAPTAGTAGFVVTCTDAPPSAHGAFLLSPSAAVPATRVLGIDLHVSLGPAAIVESVRADALGDVALPVPLTGIAPGSLGFAQFVFLPTPSCPGTTAPLASGHGLSIRVR